MKIPRVLFYFSAFVIDFQIKPKFEKVCFMNQLSWLWFEIGIELWFDNNDDIGSAAELENSTSL